jgi:hypothetical protein
MYVLVLKTKIKLRGEDVLYLFFYQPHALLAVLSLLGMKHPRNKHLHKTSNLKNI